MKKSVFFVLFLVVLNGAFAQTPLWTVGNARTVEYNTMAVSAFQNLRYGITRKMEIGAQPLGLLFAPNIYLKKQWLKTDLLVTSRHGIYTPIIGQKRFQSSEKTFPGFMKAEREIIYPLTNTIKPNVTFTNEVLFSSYIQKPTSCTEANYLLTGKVGFHFSVANKNQVLDSIFYPVFFMRTQPYQGQLMWYLGLQLDGHLYFENLDFSTDIQFLSLGKFTNWSIEHKGLLLITQWENTRVLVGYKLAYSTLASQASRTVFLPLLDFTYTFKFKGKKQGGDLSGFKRGKPEKQKKEK